MDCSSSIGIQNNCTNVSPTNLLDNLYRKVETNKNDQKDKIIITKDFIADLEYDKKMGAFGSVLAGKINGYNANLKTVTNNNDENWYEGAINKKYFLMHCNNKKYDGKYGDKDFNLTIDYNEPSKISEFFNQKISGKIFMPDYFTIKGHFGDSVIDITLPNVKVPDDIEIRNLITMLLEDNGFKAQTINGEVKSLKFSYAAVKNLKKRAEKRKKIIDNDIKPIIMQGISSVTGIIIGSVMSALLLKFGIKH